MLGTMPGACTRGRQCPAWMDNIEDVDRTPRGTVNQNDRDKCYSETTVYSGIYERSEFIPL